MSFTSISFSIIDVASNSIPIRCPSLGSHFSIVDIVSNSILLRYASIRLHFSIIDVLSNSMLLRNPSLRYHCSIIDIVSNSILLLHFDLIFRLSISYRTRFYFDIRDPDLFFFDYRYRIELKSRSKSTIPLFNYRYRIELDSPSMSFSVQTHFSIIDIASNSNLLRYPSLRSLFSIIGFVSNSTSPLIFVTTLPCFDYRCRIGFASITVSSADALGQNRNPCLKLFNCSSRSCRNGPRGQGREGRKRSTDRTDGDLDRPRSSADMIWYDMICFARVVPHRSNPPKLVRKSCGVHIPSDKTLYISFWC